MLRSTLHTKKKIGYFLFTLPAILLFSILFGFPMFRGIYLSMTDWNGIRRTYHFTGLTNYIRVFTDARTLNSLSFTFRYALLLVVCILVLSMTLALMVTYAIGPRSRTFFRSMFFTPVVFSLITVGLIFNEIFYRAVPQLGRMLGIALLSKNILGNPKTVIYGILIVSIWQGVGIPFIMFLAGLQNIPSDVYEAAKIDGANAVQVFTRITVPFLLPIINVVFVITVRHGLTVFEYIQAMSDGGPMRASESLGFLVYKLAFWERNINLAISLSVILLIAILSISIVQIKVSSRFEAGQL